MASEDPKTSINTDIISLSTTDNNIYQNKEIESLIQENKTLEEIIVVLKTTRNNLSLSVEDLKDENDELKTIAEVIDLSIYKLIIIYNDLAKTVFIAR